MPDVQALYGALAAHDEARMEARSRAGLERITRAIRTHPGTGQVRRLVAFVAGCYNGVDFPFDLSELRGLDRDLSDACLDVLNFDRLGRREIHKLLPGGEDELHQWLRDYGMLNHK